MGRLVASRSKQPGARWYQFSPTRFHCPKCDVEVRSITRPVGYVLQVLIVVAVAASVLFVKQLAFGSLWFFAVALGGLCLLVVLLALCCTRWGFSYSLAPRKRGHEDAAL